MDKKYYTVEEANKLLPKIKPILAKMVKLQCALASIEGVTISFNEEFMAYAHAITVSEKYYKISAELYRELKKLLDVGCIVKDTRIGLIDFYSQCNGEDIFLCYHLGEETIMMWHDSVSGFQGRKSISLLEKHDRF